MVIIYGNNKNLDKINVGDVLVFDTIDINFVIDTFKTIQKYNPKITDYSICSNVNVGSKDLNLELHLFGKI